jgi:hypothetical protein
MGDPTAPDVGRLNGWAGGPPSFDPPELPAYVGPVNCCRLPLVEDPAELQRRSDGGQVRFMPERGTHAGWQHDLAVTGQRG